MADFLAILDSNPEDLALEVTVPDPRAEYRITITPPVMPEDLTALRKKHTRKVRGEPVVDIPDRVAEEFWLARIKGISDFPLHGPDGPLVSAGMRCEDGEWVNNFSDETFCETAKSRGRRPEQFLRELIRGMWDRLWSGSDELLELREWFIRTAQDHQNFRSTTEEAAPVSVGAGGDSGS